MLIGRSCFARQVLIVQNGIEDQWIGADGFAAINGIIAEEQHVALTEVSVDDDGMFSDGPAFVEKAIEQERLPVLE